MMARVAAIQPVDMEGDDMKELRGVVPILPATFSEDGRSIDHESLANTVVAAMDDGADAVALFGIVTEFYKLSDDERKAMIKTTVAASSGRVPVIVSVTRNSTELAVQDARLAEELGADCLMMFSPHFFPPSTAQLLDHIQAIAESVDIPLIIQYTPGVGGGKLEAEDIFSIQSRVRNEIYLKAEPVPNGPIISRLMELSGGSARIFIGNAGFHMIDAFQRGAVGVMPGSAVVKVYKTIYQSFMSGDLESAWRQYGAIMPLFLLINQSAEMLTAFEKRILKQRGIIRSDCCRKPCFTIDRQYWQTAMRHYQTIRETMDVGKDYDFFHR